MAGTVINRSDQHLRQTNYDIAVLGAGLLGLAAGFYLKSFLPHKEIVIVEEEGIPSEQGITHVSPGIFATEAASSQLIKRKHWIRKVLQNLEYETGIKRSGAHFFNKSTIVKFSKRKEDISLSTADALSRYYSKEQSRALKAMIDLSAFPYLSVDEEGGYGSAEAVALNYGYGAVKLGVDLILNTRVDPINESKLKLSRLEYSREMKRVTAGEGVLHATTVVVALGARTPGFVEDAVGELLPYQTVYRQYPRIEVDERLPLQNNVVDLPIIHANGFYLRPQGEGLLIVPPALSADPKGYEPTEGKMMGVRVGIRREILEQLMVNTEVLPVLAWDSLNLGKTVSKVRGTWELITSTNLPEWRALETSGWYSLVGGLGGFSLGIASAYDLAAKLSASPERPWS